MGCGEGAELALYSLFFTIERACDQLYNVFFFCGARAPALQALFLGVLVVVVVDKRFVTVGKGPGRGPVATVTNRCDWENQTVGAEPNTLCRLQTVNLLANPNGPVRAKRGLKRVRIGCRRLETSGGQ
jgi:hypothetical protein